MHIFQAVACPQTSKGWNGMVVRDGLTGEIATPRCPDCGLEFNWSLGYPTLVAPGCDAYRRAEIMTSKQKAAQSAE